jgi:competence protein ComEC
MDFWNQAPFARLIFPLIAGVIMGIEYSVDYALMYLVLAALLLTILFTGLGRIPLRLVSLGYWQATLVYTFVFAGGWAITDASEDIRRPTHFSYTISPAGTYLNTRVIEPPQPRDNSIRMVVQVEQVLDGDATTRSEGRLLVYLQKDSSAHFPEYGDQVLIQARVQPIELTMNPGQFDYKRHLRNKHIHHQCFARTEDWKIVATGGGNPLYRNAFALRNTLLQALDDLFEEEQDMAVASALLLGYKERLDRDILLSYSSAGAMHVLAVSGLHVGIIFLVLDLLTRVMDRSKKLRLYKALILIACLWFYAIITGLSPSVERSATMFSFIVIGKLIGRSTSVYNTLSASAFLLIILNPYIITEVGFQLSYIAVLGIVFIQPKLYPLLYVKNKLLDKVWAITCVSIAAQIATFPLGIYYFHQFPNYFLFSNLVVIPMASVILYAGFLFFLTLPLGELVSDLMGQVLVYAIRFLNSFIGYIEELPYALTYGISATITELLLLYVVVIAIMAWFRFRLRFWLFTGLCFIASLLVYQFTQVLEHNEQEIITVFHVRNSTAINLVSGRNNYLLAHDDLLHDDDRILFHMRHFWFQKRTDDEQRISIESDTVAGPIRIQDHMIWLNGKTLLLVDTTMNYRVPQEPIRVDYLMLTDNARIWLEKWLEMVECRYLIIDASNKPGKAEYWQKKAEKAGARVHNIITDGAFQEIVN